MAENVATRLRGKQIPEKAAVLFKCHLQEEGLLGLDQVGLVLDYMPDTVVLQAEANS